MPGEIQAPQQRAALPHILRHDRDDRPHQRRILGDGGHVRAAPAEDRPFRAVARPPPPVREVNNRVDPSEPRSASSVGRRFSGRSRRNGGRADAADDPADHPPDVQDLRRARQGEGAHANVGGEEPGLEDSLLQRRRVLQVRGAGVPGVLRRVRVAAQGCGAERFL